MGATQYNSTGKKMDVTNFITNISPSDTPLMNMFGQATATEVVKSWEEDELRKPRDNAKPEGFSYVTEEARETTLKDNVCQIFEQGYEVTKTSQAIERFNIRKNNKLAYEMRKAMKEIALDVENAIITAPKKVTGAKDASRRFGGLPYFLKSNVLDNGGTARPLTYDLLGDAMERIFQEGGNPDVIVVSGRNKRVVSGLLPLSTDRTQKAEAKKLIHTIDIFEGDFGRQRVVKNRWMPNDRVYVLSSEYFDAAYLRRFTKTELPETKDAKNEIIVGELTLVARAEKASAVITDLDGQIQAA